MHRALWLVALALVAVVVAGCGGGGGQQPSQPAAQPPSGPSSPAPASSPASPGGAAMGSEIKIVGKDNLWEPVNVTLKAGQEYEFVVTNEGTTVHNYIINSKDQAGQDFASDIAVNAGQESKFKVKIDKPGTYKVTCTYHPEMTGEVKVE